MSETLLDVLAAHRRAGAGDRPALVDQHGHLTYSGLEREVSACARALAGAGLGAGSRIAVVLTGALDSVVRFAAVTALDAAVLVLQQRITATERSSALADFGAEVLLDADGLVTLSPPVVTRSSEPAFAVTSSGTMGKPKVISREWAGTLRNSSAFAERFGLDRDDIVLTTSPLGHCYAIEAGTLAVLSAGACQLIPPGPLTPAQAADFARRHRPTVLQTVPVILGWYGRQGVCESSDWRRCVSAADVLPADVAAQWQRAGIPVADHYGNSELGPLTLAPVGGAGDVGAALPGVTLRAGQDRPEPVSARFPGLAPVRLESGQSVPLTDDGGWVCTGDVGVLDGDVLRLAGRSDSMINVAGNKVDPAEVERVLRGLSGVGDCAVVGRPGPAGAEQVWAFVEAPADGFDAAVLRRDASRLLSGSKVPAVIRRVDELPRTGSGKVRRGLLAEEG
ncbi:MAG: class I adenylate-forming enzyme family protein [Pseudonocardiaceae bacterium]